MPTDYVGDATATQVPSDPPGPEADVTVALPADGDPPNASTWEQAFKVLADFVAWLFRPIAELGAFADHIMTWRSATGHRRFVVDHLGFPSGNYINVETYWPNSTPTGGGANYFGTQAATRMPSDPKWVYKSIGDDNSADGIVLGANTSGPTCTVMKLEAGPAAAPGDFMVFCSGPYGKAVPWMHVVMETLSSSYNNAKTNVDFACVGLGEWDGSTSAVGMNDFIGFETRNGTTWQCVTRSIGAEHVTNTLINIVREPLDPLGAPIQRLKVELHGESVAEDGLRRVRFYIDGALVATHDAHIPIGPDLYAVFGLQRGPTEGDPIVVGPIRAKASLFPADVGF